MTDYEQFIHDKGYKYENENDLKAAYDRKWKSAHGILIDENEFVSEIAPKTDEAKQRATELYARLVEQHMNGVVTPQMVYGYAVHRWCMNDAAALTVYEVGNKKWVVNNCDEAISNEQAIIEINEEWGFEASRVKIIGTPYYDATDWMFIRFDCARMSWLWANGELYQVYH